MTVLTLLTALAGLAQAGDLTASALPASAKPVPEAQRASAVQLWKLGLGFFSDGDLDRARALWFSCGSLDPANEDCRKALQGLDHVGSARPAAAQTQASASAEPAKESVNKGQQLASKESTALLAKAKAEENKLESVHQWNLGVSYFQKSEFVKARDAWALCTVLDAGNQDCLSSLKKAEQALKKSSPSSANDRQNAIRHWNAGIAFFQKGDFAKAREEWQACVRLDPENGDCQTGVQRMDQTIGGTH